ncbi:hypothetical protein SADUNF_Sadunf04G0166500 [Salix dunnii]|uniref:Late embryogenesis abundant protein LEA-2 subgroup domain-containing protein n=1 Tax=Salix dunnii TaxID=1413687 RepID=A0A835KCZ9_9ROSI|nr:hypothetical protein SADUNF_Sadunf04G0166500 [Salix dunnii]
MDVESSKAAVMKAESPKKHKRRNICLGVTAAVILFIFLLLLILGLTVFKPKQPTTTVDSTSIRDLKVSFDMARLRVDVNLSLDVDLSIKNPNKGFHAAILLSLYPCFASPTIRRANLSKSSPLRV